MEKQNVLHIITVSFVINHFFGNQFNYLKSKTGSEYHLGCSKSEEFLALSSKFGYVSFPVEITRNISIVEDIKAIFKVFFYIKKNKIDVVVGHTPKGGMIAMIASYAAGVSKRIYFRHGIIYETSTSFKKIMLKNIDRLSGFLATEVVCVSESVKKISEDDQLNDPKKNTILGLGTCNGIDTENKFNPEKIDSETILNLKLRLNISDDDFVVGYVGRLVKDKGINELLQACEILRLTYKNLKLLLVGPIEERDAITEDSKNLIKNRSYIIHTGFILNSAPYFSLMDIFVLPTYREGFSTVALEASAMELPVIITRATGCEEAIIENKTGLFIKSNKQDIAEKIKIYMNNRALIKDHGNAGREFVRNNFEQTIIWDIINKKLKY